MVRAVPSTWLRDYIVFWRGGVRGGVGETSLNGPEAVCFGSRDFFRDSRGVGQWSIRWLTRSCC